MVYILYISFSEDVVLPEKPKLKFMNKVPNLKKAKKEMKRLRDIQGPAKTANSFTSGQYAIVVSGYVFCRHSVFIINCMCSYSICKPLTVYQ